MSDNALDAELHQFVARFIGSLEQLEILLLLSENPQQPWTSEAVFHVVQSSKASVAKHLQGLSSQGFLRAEAAGTYRYQPTRPELAEAVSALCRAYRQRRVAVIEMIYRRPSTMQDFTEAFRLRKQK